MFKVKTFIAGRLGIRGGSSGLMLRVATFSVAVSMMVMLIALAVVGGFRTEIGKQISGFTSHIQITAKDNGHSYESAPMDADPDLVDEIYAIEATKHVQRFSAKAGILRGDSTIQGILLKGIGWDYDTSFLHGKMAEGVIPAYNDSIRSREAVISKTLAREMNLQLGDRFEVLFIGTGAPKRDRLRIAGIYHSGMPEFDRMTVIGDMKIVQRLNGWNEKEISGYEVAIKTRRGGIRGDIAAIEKAVPDIQAITGDALFGGWGADSDRSAMEVLTVRDRYPHIYDWLDMLGLNATIVIAIMIVVAIVNMISGVLIVVLEQTRTIGILKALGMRGGMLRQIFILRTAGVTGKGMLWGNAIGLGLCLIQYLTGAVSLDAGNYMIPTVPVSLDWGTVIGLNIAVFAAVTGMMALPTLLISRITPDKAIRFQ